MPSGEAKGDGKRLELQRSGANFLRPTVQEKQAVIIPTSAIRLKLKQRVL